jgi:hypothetical protein
MPGLQMLDSVIFAAIMPIFGENVAIQYFVFQDLDSHFNTSGPRFSDSQDMDFRSPVPLRSILPAGGETRKSAAALYQSSLTGLPEWFVRLAVSWAQAIPGLHLPSSES